MLRAWLYDWPVPAFPASADRTVAAAAAAADVGPPIDVTRR